MLRKHARVNGSEALVVAKTSGLEKRAFPGQVDGVADLMPTVIARAVAMRVYSLFFCIGPCTKRVEVAQPLPGWKVKLVESELVGVGVQQQELVQVASASGGKPGASSNAQGTNSRLKVLSRGLDDGNLSFVMGMDVEIKIDGRSSLVEAKAQQAEGALGRCGVFPCLFGASSRWRGNPKLL